MVEDAENAKLAAWMNDTPAIIVNIQRQPGANVIEVVDRVKAAAAHAHRRRCPPRSRCTLLTDRTVTIRASVHDTQFELLLAIGARGGGDLRLPAQRHRARSSPRAAVPLSIVGTFGVMYLAGLQRSTTSR